MKQAILTCGNEKKIEPYVEALRAVGIVPVIATPDCAPDSLGGLGLVVSGGSDLDPALYGAEAEPLTDPPDHARDAMQKRLLAEALAKDLPVLAICGGMQLFNVLHGGTLIQHIEGHRVPLHDATILDGTLLATILGAGPRRINSRHHQIVGRLGVTKPGDGLTVSARAADGIIEAIERPDRRFAVAVQWHPEDLLPQDRALFEAFGNSL